MRVEDILFCQLIMFQLTVNLWTANRILYEKKLISLKEWISKRQGILIPIF
jgi:hypothetical protein